LVMGDLVLRLPVLKPLRQPAPEPVEALIGHLQNAADIAGLGAVEVVVGFRRVAIGALRIALQHAERHQRIEEVADAARMQLEAALQLRRVCGFLGELGEDAKLDRAQERLGTPEAETELQDVFMRGNGLSHGHGSSLCEDPIRDRGSAERKGENGRAASYELGAHETCGKKSKKKQRGQPVTMRRGPPHCRPPSVRPVTTAVTSATKSKVSAGRPK